MTVTQSKLQPLEPGVQLEEHTAGPQSEPMQGLQLGPMQGLQLGPMHGLQLGPVQGLQLGPMHGPGFWQVASPIPATQLPLPTGEQLSRESNPLLQVPPEVGFWQAASPIPATQLPVPTGEQLSSATLSMHAPVVLVAF
jgi:hypothetical protein